MAKIGDVSKTKGTKTTVTDIDPETGKITWSVEYTANFGELFKEVSQLLDDAKEVAQKAKDEPFFKDYFNDVKALRNRLRTYLRTEHPDEYAKIKGIDEISTSADAGAYNTKHAFGEKPAKYYYKLGYKPVDKKKLRKQAKGIDSVDLWK